jgi:hypothetical protein
MKMNPQANEKSTWRCYAQQHTAGVRQAVDMAVLLVGCTPIVCLLADSPSAFLASVFFMPFAIMASGCAEGLLLDELPYAELPYAEASPVPLSCDGPKGRGTGA